MHKKIDIHVLNGEMLAAASRLSAQNPRDAMETYGMDEKTCQRLAQMSDAEIKHVAQTNISLFNAEIDFQGEGG
jgi:hypothetical protein